MNESQSEENLMLADTTNYKEFLMNEWLSLKAKKERFLILFLNQKY